MTCTPDSPCGNIPKPGERFRLRNDPAGGHCFACYRRATNERNAKRAKAVPLPLARSDRCESLLKRTEFKVGCNGLTCRHGCKLDLPAVPGVFCQTCPAYVAEPGEPWLS